MLTLAKKIQHFVDLIVAKSRSHNEEEMFRLNHYVWIALLMLPVALCSGAYNAYINNYALAFLIILFSGHMVGSLFLIPTIQKTYLLFTWCFMLTQKTLAFFGLTSILLASSFYLDIALAFYGAVYS